MRAGIIHLILFFVYVLVQVLLLKNLVLFNVAFCFAYVAFILLLPVEISTVMIMLIGFSIGFTIDVFYSSMGLHAFTSVLTAYLRNYWLKVITPQGGYDVGVSPTLSTYGVSWFLVYFVPLVFIHLTMLFFLEASGFSMAGYTLLKIFASLLFTTLVVFLFQFMVPNRRKL
jgi:hypothetical protein